jgi:formyl-CoA transferase
MATGRPALPLLEQSGDGALPLSGVRVADFTRVMAGPFGTQILGDLGAEVIKIENPATGDDTRALNKNASLGGESAFYLSMNRSKRSVAIDLKSEDGRQVALDLIATADVLVENFSGAVMRRFRLDYPSLRARFPRLIYCSVSAYGRSGPLADVAGYNSTLSAEAGVLSQDSFADGTPVTGGLPYTDITTSLNATIGVLAALHARDRTGRGQHVDVAMFDTALANLSFRGTEYLATGRESPLPVRQNSLPYGQFDTADGIVMITAGNDKIFRAFCLDVAERPDWLEDPRFATAKERMTTHNADFLAELRTLFRSRPSAEWSARCKAAGVPLGVVRRPGDALLSEEAMDRGLVFDLPHPTAGTVPAIAQPVRFSDTPCRYGTPPLLGQHTRAVLTSLLGYDDARIEALAAGGAIGLSAQESR